MQILVVVANTQARTLWAEAEKGFARTAVGRESVGPKAWVNPIRRELRAVYRPTGSPCRKGTRRKFLDPDSGASGDAVELGDVDGHPGESCLFFLTVRTTLESVRPEIGWNDWQSAPLRSGHPVRGRRPLKTRGRNQHVEPGRTDNRSRSPR